MQSHDIMGRSINSLYLCLLSTFIIVFPILFAHGQEWQSSATTFSKAFPNILIDVRGSRGGHGDVAAGYLTVMDWVERVGIKSRITVLVDGTSKKILERLAVGNSSFWNTVDVRAIDDLQQIEFDFYLALANPSGSFRYQQQIRDRKSSPKNPESGRPNDLENKIHVKPDGILIVQTVLGNTENADSLNANGVIRKAGVNYEMSPAGIGSLESGIYNDYIAEHLKNSSPSQLLTFLNTEIEKIEAEPTRHVLNDLLSARVLMGSKIGLAYGISANQTQKQFQTYLKGLDCSGGQSYALVTPSDFKTESIRYRDLKERVVVESDFARLPAVPRKGTIYILKTKTLPHSVFVGLMAYTMRSGLVPVGAGDGFMSAAINLGGPFVLTRVSWNAKNIENLRSRLAAEVDNLSLNLFQRLRLKMRINQIYGAIDLSKAQELLSVRHIFESVSQKVPDLSERILNAAMQLSAISESSLETRTDQLNEISDPVLRESIRVGGTAKELATADKSVGYKATDSPKSLRESNLKYFKIAQTCFVGSKSNARYKAAGLEPTDGQLFLAAHFGLYNGSMSLSPKVSMTPDIIKSENDSFIDDILKSRSVLQSNKIRSALSQVGSTVSGFRNIGLAIALKNLIVNAKTVEDRMFIISILKDLDAPFTQIHLFRPMLQSLIRIGFGSPDNERVLGPEIARTYLKIYRSTPSNLRTFGDLFDVQKVLLRYRWKTMKATSLTKKDDTGHQEVCVEIW